MVKELGGQLVESVFDCTHLVTDDKLRRTLKLLCCIGRGCPIVSTQWLKKCKQQKKFVCEFPPMVYRYVELLASPIFGDWLR